MKTVVIPSTHKESSGHSGLDMRLLTIEISL